MGEMSYCGQSCLIGVYGTMKIGKYVQIAPAVTIRDTDHAYDDLSKPMQMQGFVTRDVTIEDDVWIGHGATILKGVRIGKSSIVGAGAVVTHDVEAYSIVGGAPARVIGKRRP